MNYGLPYKGSKSKIANWVLSYLPPANTLVDLFFGGGAITHCAMRHRRYSHYVINDIQIGLTDLFVDAMKGKFHNEYRWISREEFFAKKDSDAYIRYCWSFGNNGRDYLYSQEIESYKKACHLAVVFNEWGEFKDLCPDMFQYVYEELKGISDKKQRRLCFSVAIEKRLKEIGDASFIENSLLQLESLQRLERLQGLERLERLQGLERLERYNLSYEQVPIPQGAIVYADIPYIGTNEYIGKRKEGGFDYQSFYEWVRTRDFPVWVSEYTMPNDFVCIGAKQKVVCMSATVTSNYIEKIFVYKRWADKIFKPTLF